MHPIRTLKPSKIFVASKLLGFVTVRVWGHFICMKLQFQHSNKYWNCFRIYKCYILSNNFVMAGEDFLISTVKEEDGAPRHIW